MNFDFAEILEQAATKQKMGDINGAKKDFLHILAKDPGNILANFNLALLFSHMKRHEEATTHFEVALRHQPNDGRYWVCLIENLLQLERYNDARTVLRNGKRQGLKGDVIDRLEVFVSYRLPTQEEIDAVLTLYNGLVLREAEKKCNYLLKKYPLASIIYNILGAVTVMLGEEAKAKDLYLKAIICNPSDFSPYNNIVSLALQKTNLEVNPDICSWPICISPNQSELFNNKGAVLHQLGNYQSALEAYAIAIELRITNQDAHYNMGRLLEETGKYEDARICYKKALMLLPNYKECLSKKGFLNTWMSDLDFGRKDIDRALILSPLMAEAHLHRGCSLLEEFDLDRATLSLRKAVLINPVQREGYENLAIIGKQLVNDNLFHRAVKYISVLSKAPVQSNRRIIALYNFARSGSMFLHSLVDGHPEIETLPGVFLRGWFGSKIWQKLSGKINGKNWREDLADKVISHLEPLFDANSQKNTIDSALPESNWLARDLGLTQLGKAKSQSLQLQIDKFENVLKELLYEESCIDQSSCFELIHRAFDLAVRNNQTNYALKSKNIFYHLHNPRIIESEHFFRTYPNAKKLYIIRNPLQSLESWLLMEHGKGLKKWHRMVCKIRDLFACIYGHDLKQGEAAAIRLEDIKKKPDEAIKELSRYLNVAPLPCLSQSTFCGLDYWGPPSISAPNIKAFDRQSIEQPLGRVFTDTDQLIFETLFWPFNFLHGYTSLPEKDFRRQLNEIYPLLSSPLNFEKKLYLQRHDRDKELEALTNYKFLHRMLLHYWRILDTNGTYPNMIKPIKV